VERTYASAKERIAVRHPYLLRLAIALVVVPVLPAPSLLYQGVALARAGDTEAAGLPGNILIADADNNRIIEVTPDKRIAWEFPRPGDLAPGQSFIDPDDAFYTPGGHTIITNEEDNHTITIIDYATHKIVWQYGHPGHPGSAPGYLNTPDDAYQLPDGRISVADIKNCRILLFDPPPARHIQRQFGISRDCRASPASPGHFLYPNGDTPLPNGNLLITEIGTRSALELDVRTGRILYRVPLPVAYPSDTQPTRAGHYLVVDYSRPGKIVVVTRTGKVVWSYGPASGPGRLDHPSLALELPNGNFLLNDDYNNRVMVVGRNKKILWQYGHTGVPGRAPGYLRDPDGVDVKPQTFGR
jgi:DNA-binding beta-propeller fold protein YncE